MMKPNDVPGWVQLCGRAAPVSSLAVFLAPMPTILQISSDRSVGSLPLLPYSSMIVNSVMWVAYGVLRRESKIVAPNAVGLLLGLCYFVQFRRHCPKTANNLPGTLSQHVRGTTILAFVTVAVAASLSEDIAVWAIGKAAVLVCLIMFASPLSTLKSVIETKSAKSIPLPFTLACACNCSLWSIVGVLEMSDFNLYFPNLLGLSFAIAQLVLVGMYGKGKPFVDLPI